MRSVMKTVDEIVRIRPRTHRRSTRKSAHRSGSVVILVVAFLVLVTALGGTGLRRIARARQTSNLRMAKLQQDAILESALARFLQKQRLQAEFSGDEWNVDLASPKEEEGSVPRQRYLVRTSKWGSKDSKELGRVHLQLIDLGNQNVIQEKWFEGSFE